MSSSARRGATLLAARRRSVSGVSDVALRQRLTQLRKRGPLSAGGTLPDAGLAWGRLRRALRQALLGGALRLSDLLPDNPAFGTPGAQGAC